MKKVTIIAAMTASNQLMGNSADNNIPWYCSEDFIHFKKTTTGSVMIMGHKTFKSLLGILPGRIHIVLSKSVSGCIGGVYYTSSLKKSLALAKNLSNSDNIYIIGGAEIIKLALLENVVDEMIITKIYANIDLGKKSVFFPPISDQWEVTEESEIMISKKSKPENLEYQMITYNKKIKN